MCEPMSETEAQQPQPAATPRRSIGRRLLKAAGWIVAAPFILLAIVAVALYLPPVQDAAVRAAAAYASEATGMDITIERLRLSFPLDLAVSRVEVRQEGHTIAAVESVVVDLDITRLLHGSLGVDAVNIDGLTLDTRDLIASMALQGTAAHLELHDDIALREQRVDIAAIAGGGIDLSIALRDTTVADTVVSTPPDWTIALRQACLTDTRVSLSLNADTTTLDTHLDTIALHGGLFALAEACYSVAHAVITADTLAATMLTADTLAAPSRYAIGRLTLKADSLCYDGTAAHIALPALTLRTDSSSINLAAQADLAALEPGAGGHLSATLRTNIAKADIVSLTASMLPPEFAAAYPDRPLHIGVSVEGNIDLMRLTQLEAALPGSIYADAAGTLALTNATDTTALAGTAQAGIGFNVKTQDLAWVRTLAGGALRGISLPPMQAGGTVTVDGSHYALQAMLQEGAAVISINGKVDNADVPAYEADLSIRRLNMRHFMPRDSLGMVELAASVSGRGTDLLRHDTRLAAEATVSRLDYGSMDLGGLSAQAKVEQGKGHVHAEADCDLLRMSTDIYALLNRQTDITFGIDLTDIDLHGLGLTTRQERASMCLHMDGTTNLRDSHSIAGGISDITIMPADTVFRPDDITLEAVLRPDTTHVYLQSGDLLLTANGHTAYDKLLTQMQRFIGELTRQIDNRHLDNMAMRHCLPQIDMHLRAGSNNPVHDMLQANGLAFSQMRFDMLLGPDAGLNAGGHVYQLNTGTLVIDTIALRVAEDTTGIHLNSRVRNGRRNPQVTFEARFTADMLPDGARANLLFYDQYGRKGVDLGAQVQMLEDKVSVHLDPLHPIIAYRTFHLNDSNYVSIDNDSHIEADIDLVADDGTGLKLYSTPNDAAEQDLSLSINQLNLGELSSVLPYMPHLSGYLHGDAHLVATQADMSVSAEMETYDFTYEGAYLGQLGLQAVYLPNNDGSHFVDGSLLHMGMPVAAFTGTYASIPHTDLGQLDIDATLDRFPFSLANGFIPDGMARLEGVAIGDVHVGGTTARPVVDGHMSTSGLRMLSEMYSLDLKFADDTLHVDASNLSLDRMEVYSAGTNPFVIDGQVNFADLDAIRLNINMSAKDYELINARKTHRNRNAVAYGKVFVDVSAMLRGTLDNLNMYGRLKVLGDTDVTYVMGDSPLTVEDQLADLVEFVEFDDTVAVHNAKSEKPQNLNIAMNVSIDNAAQVHCLLSSDGSSYVDIEGGGDLMVTYTPERDLQLHGRYTINSGKLKYTMMVIPLKEFAIKSGSYVEFRGSLLNPHLNLSATERMRTTVTENDQPRSVNFDVGMNITQTLDDLGLEFTLDAPEDMNIQNEIAAMSTEQRGKVAVTMLATGMYITDSSLASAGAGFSTQNALNAFLQSQISSIAGKALKSVDLSLGVEQGTSATGSTTTDYSFRFAKRFWGNRVSVIVGGKVSTGEDAQNTGQTLIDNVSIEYRLDKAASRSVSLFYDKNYETLLEGEVTEMGAGLVLRKKAKTFGELFIFSNK